MEEENKRIILITSIVFVFLLIVGFLGYNTYMEQVNRIEYCNSSGFDNYSYECKDKFCIKQQYYCLNNNNTDRLNLL